MGKIERDCDCSKCGKPIPWGYGGWEKTTFLDGKIVLQVPSGGERNYKKHVKKYIETIEVSKETTGQKLILEFGKEKPYTLCYSCRDLLIETLAKFFNTKI